MYLEIAREDTDTWPGVLAFYRSEGAVGTVVYPLVFGAMPVGERLLHTIHRARDHCGQRVFARSRWSGEDYAMRKAVAREHLADPLDGF